MDFTSLLFPLLILVLFIPIFLSGRRQRRQMQEMQSLQSSLEPGDVVMTTSGLRGTVVDASYEETIDIEIADGIVTTWVRAAVREKVNPPADDTTGATGTDEPVVVDAEPVADADTATGTKADTGVDTAKADTPSLQKDDSTNGSTRG
ncbi:preprotein translocase subunit YajC [Pseudonocardia lacus]|uniref:preprotein translocase subunit YajC n=1 Tax=Pseudonocardia lacus TaxID=2835865 RepID=UPI001BDD6E1E|nr:preprotein translocase subunit YajC [Pseudonocardia lacus]